MTARIKREAQPVAASRDTLSSLAPLLRVWPELQDFCRFGGGWRLVHGPEEEGWAAFHIVTAGSCSVERQGCPTARLEAGDVLLLPHGDGHVVYDGSDSLQNSRPLTVIQSDHITVKQTNSSGFETEIICGRLHLERSTENILLKVLPRVMVLRLAAIPRCADLVEAIREELVAGRTGAAAIARDLASATFVMMLRAHFELEPPTHGLVALLGHRETAKAMAAMLSEPAKDWALDDLATISAVSRATLVRAFRRIGGLPPQAFLTEVRLGLARGRITRTSDGLAQIAEDVGYQSEAALSRALYRRFGVRPGGMRGGQGRAEVRSLSQKGRRSTLAV